MPRFAAKVKHRYAVVIAARNEREVIGSLIDSIRAQRYPVELIDIYVVADNCTDDTAETARRHGAIVLQRENMESVGKGYALNFAFCCIEQQKGLKFYDGYFVFDADNVLDEHYIMEMNNVFDAGYRVVTSYRNSKNYGSNWISAGYGLWFLREAKYLNGARMICRTSCAISGTGFLVSSDILSGDKGWRYNLLTEDIEFTVDKVIGGEVIGYCENAVFFDEQPVDFAVSWRQRVRWSRGFYQVIWHYGKSLAAGCLCKRKFQCFDMFMTVAPAALLSIALLCVNCGAMLYLLAESKELYALNVLYNLGVSLVNYYISFLVVGLITLVTEWKRIYCSVPKKIFYLFTFPLFMFTYVPIAVAALLYKKVEWTPIRHVLAQSVSDIRR